MDSENEKSSHQVKTRRFVLDNKHKCQIKRNHSSTRVSLAASAILFQKLCRLFQISSGGDGRASKSGRRAIKRTGILLPIPAALPLAQTNWLNVSLVYLGRKNTRLFDKHLNQLFTVQSRLLTNLKKAMEKTVGKGKNAVNRWQHFSFFPQRFPLYQREKSLFLAMFKLSAANFQFGHVW